ncbi:MAG: YeeE/YedE family protein [Hyphomicrobiaceae bacterium]|nr:YeeE/YedE family protein [Hyphomicrobiaceae bacterium]
MIPLPQTEWTLVSSFVGGCLIGLAAVALMAVYGRIAGMTGVLASLLPPAVASDWDWRVAFLAGLIASPLAYWLVTGKSVDIVVPVSPLMLLVSGLIVGIGVTFGSGCTSGHGVCGLSRFSRRSLVAVLTFMAFAALTVFVTRHLISGA